MTSSPASSAWNARYGNTTTLPSSVNPILAHLLSHCSVRAYDPAREVSDEVLSQAVAAAQSASTSSNLQVWSVIAVRAPGEDLNLAERRVAIAEIGRASCRERVCQYV